MQVLKFAAVVAGVLLLFARGAAAADASDAVVGKWVDKLPNGTLMLIEFTPNSMAFQQVDPSNGRGLPATTMSVSYKKEGDVLRLTPSSAEGSPLTLTVKNADTVILQFDGMGERTLVRQKDAPPAMPRGHGMPKADTKS